ncbi:hypothetical protein LC040_02530 [Bacillus tianshenii]|nr:hypothetical protein LC040_02530 [Bacillus tianshenii]
MYGWYPPYYRFYPSIPAYRLPNPSYPPVEVERFRKSAKQLTPMLKQAEAFVYQITESKKLRTQIKEAAQRGEEKEVHRLIRSAGIVDLWKTSYTPDTIHILLQPSNSSRWSDVVLTMRW